MILSDLRQRVVEPEIMDQPDLDPARHRAALRGIARLNAWSGSVGTIWSAIRSQATPTRPFRILDVGCGGGDVLVGIGRRAARAGLRVELAGCDISPKAIQLATENTAANRIQADFTQLDVTKEPLPAGFDCIISSLFLHHLHRAQAVDLLRNMKSATSGGLAVYDLVRSRPGLLLSLAATQLLTRCEVVHTDGPRSVCAAFRIAEVRELASEAGLDNADVRRRWPCRYLLTWSGSR